MMYDRDTHITECDDTITIKRAYRILSKHGLYVRDLADAIERSEVKRVGADRISLASLYLWLGY